jgi:hypothetical protein
MKSPIRKSSRNSYRRKSSRYSQEELQKRYIPSAPPPPNFSPYAPHLPFYMINNNSTSIRNTSDVTSFDINKYDSNWKIDNTIIIYSHGTIDNKGYVIDNYNILSYTKQFNYLLLDKPILCPNEYDISSNIINYKLFKQGNKTNKLLLDSYKENYHNNNNNNNSNNNNNNNSNINVEKLEKSKPHLYKQDDIIFDSILNFSLEVISTKDDKFNQLHGILSYKDFSHKSIIEIFNNCRNYPYNPYNNKTILKGFNSQKYPDKFNNFFLKSIELNKKNKMIYNKMLSFIHEGEYLNGNKSPGIVLLSTLIRDYLSKIFNNKRFNIILLACKDNKKIREHLDTLFKDYSKGENSIINRLNSRNRNNRNNNNNNKSINLEYTSKWLTNKSYPSHLQFKLYDEYGDQQFYTFTQIYSRFLFITKKINQKQFIDIFETEEKLKYGIGSV